MTTQLPRVPEQIAATEDGRAPAPIRAVYVANLAAQIGIIVTGAVVRLTGSGLGCPTWPRCTDGSFVPVEGQSETWHKYVEFGNRSLTFVLGVLAIASLVVAVSDARRRRRSALPARPVLTWLAAVPLLGTVAQAILGGITVLTGLNPLSVSAHFVLSLVIVALLTTLVWRASETADSPATLTVRPDVRTGIHALGGVMAVVLLVGTLVTASGPHAGDARTPRLGLDPQTVSWLHADLVLLAIGLLVGLQVALRATAAPDRVRHLGVIALLLFLAQGAVGYLQYFTGLPWLVVAVHALGSALVWWATMRLLLSTKVRGTASA